MDLKAYQVVCIKEVYNNPAGYTNVAGKAEAGIAVTTTNSSTKCTLASINYRTRNHYFFGFKHSSTLSILVVGSKK